MSSIPSVQIGNGPTVHHLAGATSDAKYLYNEIFVDKVYLRYGITIDDGDCIFDVGANIGMFSMFAMLHAEQLDIYAFEPVPPTFDILEMNLSPENLENQGNIKPMPYGLSDQATSLEISFFPESPTNSTCYLSDKRSESSLVNSSLKLSDVWRVDKIGFVLLLLLFPFRHWLLKEHLKKIWSNPVQFEAEFLTLDSVIEENNVETINLLKVDVEGSEFDVLDGISEENWSRVQQLVAEVSPSNSDKLPAFEDALKRRGFTNITLESLGYDHYKPELGTTCNIYATR